MAGDNWYPHLSKHTFESRFIELNHDDIQYLMGTPTPEYDTTKLETVFNAVLAEFNNQEAFMRLSTRSPKDSKYLFEEASTLMSEDLTYWNENDNKNQQLVSFVTSMLQAMKIKNGKKIIEMIAQSPRVYGDLIALLSSDNPSDVTTKIILREWHDIRPDHEFRMFVSRRNRKESIVTAVSQYFHFLSFDKVPADCFNFLDEENKNAIISKFENYILKAVDPEVAKFLNFSSEQDDDDSSDCIREYIVDLALIPLNQYHGEVTAENKIVIGESTFIMMVVELNPFAPAATGSGLFNWKDDLMTLWGKASCEYPKVSFRTTPREDLTSVTLLPSNYESVIESALSKRLAKATAPTVELSGSFLLDVVNRLMSNPLFGCIGGLLLLAGAQVLVLGGAFALGASLAISGSLFIAGHTTARYGFFQASADSNAAKSNPEPTHEDTNRDSLSF